MTVGEVLERLKLWPADTLVVRDDNSGDIDQPPRW